MENNLAYSLFKRISAYLEKIGSSITIDVSIYDSYIRVYIRHPLQRDLTECWYSNQNTQLDNINMCLIGKYCDGTSTPSFKSFFQFYTDFINDSDVNVPLRQFIYSIGVPTSLEELEIKMDLL
jgi:hypothetical protein